MSVEAWSAFAVVVAASLALVGSLVSIVWGARLVRDNERRQLAWGKELDRFFELEEAAGQVVEVTGRNVPPPNLGELLAYLDTAPGRFRRYPKVVAALTDLRSAYDAWLQRGRDEARAERLARVYEQLLLECDRAIKRPALE